MTGVSTWVIARSFMASGGPFGASSVVTLKVSDTPPIVSVAYTVVP